MICRSLILSAEPKETLLLLALELDQTYRAVEERLPNNQAVRFDVIDGKELVLSTLDKLDDPVSLVALRKIVKARMPIVDLPDIILEIAARTGFDEAFTHVTESQARTSALRTSLVLCCFLKHATQALSHLLTQKSQLYVEIDWFGLTKNYIRHETLTHANARLVSAQIPLNLQYYMGRWRCSIGRWYALCCACTYCACRTKS